LPQRDRAGSDPGERCRPDIAAGVSHDYRDEISASGVFIAMDQAVRATQMIPDGMTAAEGANPFCTHALRNLREPDERAKGTASMPVVACHNLASKQFLGAASSRSLIAGLLSPRRSAE
jgi:hypothetical protein